MVSCDVTEFIGIYDADSTIIGEISYWVGARLGKRHCSLCDITHGLFTKRAEWQDCLEGLPVPFVAFHRNDAPPDVLHHARGRFPCVVARHGEVIRTVLVPDDLDRLEGSPTALKDRLLNYLVNSHSDGQ